MASSWSLCLVSSALAAGNGRKVVRVNPAVDTVQDLFRLTGEAFGVPSSQVQSLKAGFPPQALDAKDATLLSESKSISNQEKVQVVLKEAKSAATSSTKSAKGAKPSTSRKKASAKKTHQEDSNTAAATTTESSGTGSAPRRSKRAAAQAATDSFAEVIKQQDRIMKEEKQQQQGKKATKRAASTTNNNQPKRAKAASFASKAPGRRLGDGAVVGSRASSPKKKKTSAKKSTLPSLPAADPLKHEDISTGLLGALGDKGTTGRIMRKGIKSAVQSSYEKTQAVARLAALESRKPEESVLMERVQSNTKLKVRFEKGVQGRGYFEETVDYIPDDVLKEVVRAIQKSEPENLRPQNLALLSPRVLWALAYRHWTTQQQQQQQAETPSPWEPFSVEEAYKQLLPDCDWSFLRRRRQQLSAKAMENLRQQQQKQDGEGISEEDHEKGAQAIHEVEQAMENLQQFDRQQRAERVASAALARQRQTQEENATDESRSWEIVTPSELDEDELKECINAAEVKDSTHVSALVKGLVDWGSIHNWRELANQTPVNLHALISENHATLNITQEQVSEWIAYARAQSVEEIIFEICDGNKSHVELLREKARAGTPKDLAVWKDMPDLLLEELDGEPSEAIALSDVARYCDRSRQVLDQFEWLDWFITPIQD